MKHLFSIYQPTFSGHPYASQTQKYLRSQLERQQHTTRIRAKKIIRDTHEAAKSNLGNSNATKTVAKSEKRVGPWKVQPNLRRFPFFEEEEEKRKTVWTLRAKASLNCDLRWGRTQRKTADLRWGRQIWIDISFNPESDKTSIFNYHNF